MEEVLHSKIMIQSDPAGNRKAASKVAEEINELFERLDELEYECEEAVAEEVARMIENAIAKAGEYLKLKVPLVGEGKVGESWKSVH